MIPVLSNEKLTLRALEPVDLDALYLWENDSNMWNVGNTLAPYSRAQLWDYIQNYDGDIFTSRQLRLMVVLRDSGESIGTFDMFDFDPFHRRCHIGLFIDPKYQGKGYGKATMNLAIDYAHRFIGLHQMVAVIPAKNQVTLNLFRSLGFSDTGILNDWIRVGNDYIDAVMLQKIF